MEIDFSGSDIICIYGTFLKKIREAEKLLSTPGCPFSESDIEKDIAPYKLILSKLDKINPKLKEMNNYRF